MPADTGGGAQDTNTTGSERPQSRERLPREKAVLNPKEIIINTKLQKARQNAMSQKILHMGYCSIGAETIGTVIRHMRLYNVQEVDLRCNMIGPDALVILSHALHHDRVGLKKISLKLNTVGQEHNVHSTRGVEALADAMSDNTKVQYLDLRFNRLHDTHMPAFKRILTSNRHILTLLLSFNNEISDKGGRVLLDAMRTNFTIQNLETHYCRMTEDMVAKIDAKVQRNRDSIVTVDAHTGEMIVKSKDVASAASRAQMIEDPCVKKVRMLGFPLQHICVYLEQLQLRAMQSKIAKLEAEDREKVLNYAGMEREAGFLKEILQLEELLVQFTVDKQETEGELLEYLDATAKLEAEIAEIERKRKFFEMKMTDKMKSQETVITSARTFAAGLQEKNYMSQVELENEKKENARLRLYLARCKKDIEDQFPDAT
ncbi:unnamed protein product [Amoebophrya sp. A25]|nr:unnamed protein product [Amoebophrya sp. A25]|eukprot:GSA25T00007561001.1